MKIIIICPYKLDEYPPVQTLIRILEKRFEHVYVTGNLSDDLYVELTNEGVTVQRIDADYADEIGLIKRLLRRQTTKRILKKFLKENYDKETIVWAVSDDSVRLLGRELLKCNYILQLLELAQNVYIVNSLKLFRLNMTKYCERALVVAHCEKNRAYICQAWWRLKALPKILPNKPANLPDIPQNSYIQDIKAREVIEQIGDRKIILYQGMLSEERPLSNFIKAVDRLGEEYAFVLMTSGNNIYQNIKSKNYYYIPFVRSPLHLEITSHAYIGILSYVPNYSVYCSPLNSIYCAPNKIFEYSKFNIPMIGNDIPGLSYPLEKYGAGIVLEEMSIDNIIKGIKAINGAYSSYQEGAGNLYKSVNIERKVNSIIDCAEKKLMRDV